MSLLKEFSASGDTQKNLKMSDGSAAGAKDVTNKPTDIKFTLMRNTLNTQNGVASGSDVNDYLERAHEINDQVESVGFALEDDDGDIIKVYVNAEQADEFEQELARLLGLDSDIESAINQVAQKFDIVDVVWPQDPGDGSEDPDAALSIDDEPDAFSAETPDGLPDSLPADDEMDDAPASDDATLNPADVVKAVKDLPKPVTVGSLIQAITALADSSPEEPSGELGADTEPEGELDPDAEPDEVDSEEAPEDDKKPKDSLLAGVADDAEKKDKKEKPADDESADDESADDESADEPDDDGSSSVDELPDEEEPVDGEEELDPELDADGNQKLDADGNPIMKKKKKPKKEKPEDDTGVGPEIAEEGLRDDIEAHVKASLAKGNKGKFYIEALTTGGHAGRRKFLLSREGKVFYFSQREQALAEAERLRKLKNRAGATASYHYEIRVVEALEGKLMTTIGTKFLQRIVEASDRADGIGDGMNITLDSQQRLLVNRLKRPIEKKLIGLYAMAGILGRLLTASDGIDDRVREAGDMLRKNRSTLNAFNAFYAALASAKGMGATPVTEAKLKRGSALQKKFETVLVALGLPEELVATDGPASVAPFIFKTVKLIDADSKMQTLLNQLAVRLGISGQDVNAPLGEDVELDEDVNVGTDDFFEAVVALALALGIPEQNLNYQRANVIKSLRLKKQQLASRSMIEQRMMALATLITKNTRQQQQPAAKTAQKMDESRTVPNTWAVQMMKDAGMSGKPGADMTDTGDGRHITREKAADAQAALKKAGYKWTATVSRVVVRDKDNSKRGMTFERAGQDVAVRFFDESKVSEGYFQAKYRKLNEAFEDLEALSGADLQRYGVEEPAYGPAMLASYEGGGTHEETVLVLGVDPSIDGPKSLTVSIDGPWDGNLHKKTFTNDKDGYKRAVEYANILRTWNAKSGGRPKGWKDAAVA